MKSTKPVVAKARESWHPYVAIPADSIPAAHPRVLWNTTRQNRDFADEQEVCNAVVQFARIEHCVWAQSMLCSMTVDDVERTLEEAARRRAAQSLQTQ